MSNSISHASNVDCTETLDFKIDGENQKLSVVMGYRSLGEMYLVGPENLLDKERAIYWYRKAAIAGDSRSIAMLASMLLDPEIGCEQHSGKIVKMFESAAIKGSSIAQYILGTYYKAGYLVEKDELVAHKYFAMAAAHNHPRAMLYLASYYTNGQSSDEDFKIGFELIENSAELGEADSQFYVGRWYHTGINHIKQNSDLAINFLSKSAAQGHIEAKALIGFIYTLNADGRKEEVLIGKEYLSQAAEGGSLDGLYHLALYYIVRGTIQEKKQIKSLLERASAQGHRKAEDLLDEGWPESMR